MSNVILQVLERDLPELPPQVAEIIEELRDPNLIDRPVLIRKINECGNLGAAVLRVVNSVGQRRGRRARSLEDAILLVGLEATRHIILGILLQALFPSASCWRILTAAAFSATAWARVLLRSSCARRRV